MFDRIERLIGKENLTLIKNKSVLIVGLGGVGGSAILSLVRSGIGKVIIIDFDSVDISKSQNSSIMMKILAKDILIIKDTATKITKLELTYNVLIMENISFTSHS